MPPTSHNLAALSEPLTPPEKLRFGGHAIFFRKAAALVHAPYGESIQQIDAKIWHFLVYRAYPSLGELRLHEVRASDILSYVGYGSIKRLQECMERLAKAELTIDWKDDNGCDHSLRAHYISFDLELGTEGLLKYSFDPILEECMASPRAFAQLSISALKRFRSKYAMKLYEIMALRERRYHKMWEPDLAEFRHQMGITSGYERFDNLRQRVLQPSLDEVNEVAPFGVLLALVRRGTGGAILKLRFKVVPRDQRTLIDGQTSERTRRSRRPQKADLFSVEPELTPKFRLTEGALKRAKEMLGQEGEISEALRQWRTAMKGRRIRSPDQSFLTWLALKSTKSREQSDLLAGLDSDAIASYISAWQHGL